MVEDLKKTKIAIINDNTGYGVLSRETVTKFLATHNLKPVYTATVDPNKPDVTDELLKAKEAGADVITEWSNATGFVARLVNARGEQNWNVPIVGHPTILQEQVAKLLYQARPTGTTSMASAMRTRSSMRRASCRPTSRRSWTSTRTRIGPYMAAGLPAFLQGNAAVTIYAAGLTKAGDTDPFKVKAALESIPRDQCPVWAVHLHGDRSQRLPGRRHQAGQRQRPVAQRRLSAREDRLNAAGAERSTSCCW